MVGVNDESSAFYGVLEVFDDCGYRQNVSMKCGVVHLGVIELPAKESKGLEVTIVMLVKHSANGAV